ncbi:cfem domain-containing [Trichoderma arundinaceum]|uniref:Cfem domain-containing n=1 Tax=Trichoderma arundinaceum TaxID=490622 RepID=A0A395NQT0_TRIAR|nr:cfem domain-containing [Trichoderma arundinaceum]
MLISPSCSLLALAFLACLCEASTQPEMQWDPDTISSCIEWYNNAGTETCEHIRDLLKITPQEFHTWNPSIGLDCKPWNQQSYCILTKEKWASFTSTTTRASKTTSTSVSTHVPSPTAWKALGCYTDDDPAWPVLEKAYSKAGGDPSLSISSCESTCWTASVNRTVLFAGVKEGNQCWCGSFVAGQTSRNQTDCNLPCSGNKTETCGGKGRLNVFAPVTTLSPSSSTSTSTTASATKSSSTSSTASPKTTPGNVVNPATHNSGAMKYRAAFQVFN